MTYTGGTSVDAIRDYRYSKTRQKKSTEDLYHRGIARRSKPHFVDRTRLLRKNSRALAVRSADLSKLSEPAMHDR